tara:strand:- start:93 stop:419 length:327 start_codon:yes stop_codon:yes gene_type:complete
MKNTDLHRVSIGIFVDGQGWSNYQLADLNEVLKDPPIEHLFEYLKVKINEDIEELKNMPSVPKELYDINRCKNMPKRLSYGIIDYEKWAEEQYLLYKAELSIEQRSHK